MTKRAFDLVAALALLPVALPAIVLLAVLIRLESPGHPIFAQKRLGRNEIVFTCYKLRTMRAGTADVPTHQAAKSAVTRVGRFLRATKLDELPQLVNVLRGEMSFVGPRPGLPGHAELTKARRAHGVFQLRPGITGLAQVEGIDMSEPEKLARRDADYAARQSLALDLRLCAATLVRKIGSGL